MQEADTDQNGQIDFKEFMSVVLSDSEWTVEGEEYGAKKKKDQSGEEQDEASREASREASESEEGEDAAEELKPPSELYPAAAACGAPEMAANGTPICNGDVVHIVSLSGSNEGRAVLSSMNKGDGLSFGSIDRMDLGWVLEMDENNPAIPFVDSAWPPITVFLRACGSDTYLLSDIPEGGMMAVGDRTHPSSAWQISLCGEDDGADDGATTGPICSGAQITIRPLAQSSDNKYRDERLLSNGEEGSEFRFGTPTSNKDNRWKLLKINNYDDDIGAVKNGSCIHLGSVTQPGTVLLSNMSWESAPSWATPDQRQDTLGWRIRAIGLPNNGGRLVNNANTWTEEPRGRLINEGNTEQRMSNLRQYNDTPDSNNNSQSDNLKNINVLTIRYGMQVTLECCAFCSDAKGNGTFFGSDMEIGKFEAVMDPRKVPHTGWFIQGGKEGSAVHIGDAILLQQAFQLEREYLHSINKDGVFHFGGNAPELGWRVGSVGKNNGWPELEPAPSGN